METQTTEKTGRASYTPESNCLYLYIGRVPRDEYLKLRAEGWRALYKQREAGGGDFVATWTPERQRTALEYADLIEDEDMGPAERAADRAERFSEYRDKRTSEATGHADRFDGQPQAHGYQSAQRAERAAARHDRLADYAGDAWSKAEYWTRRTAGVIANALHRAAPGVRMGRIKVLEALLRKHEAEVKHRQAVFSDWQKIAAIADPAKQTAQAINYTGNYDSGHSEYMHPRPETVTNARLKEHPTSLSALLSMVENGYGSNDITGAEACALFFSDHSEPRTEDAWSTHYRLRLAYENQMLAAQGGRLEQCEVFPGGKLGGKLILKVNKSPATGRATSVSIMGDKVSGWTYKASNIPGTQYAEYQFDLERLSPGSYTPPTPETLAELAAVRKAIKDAAPVKAVCPLINPTDDDAERLQALWNARELERHEAKNTYASQDARAMHSKQFEPAKVTRITQAVYSANSKGACSRAETRGLSSDGELWERETDIYSRSRDERRKRIGPAVCKLRITSGGKSCGWSYDSVIVITDKPQKPLPAQVWQKYEAPAAVEEPRKSYAGKSHGLSYSVPADM